VTLLHGQHSNDDVVEVVVGVRTKTAAPPPAVVVASSARLFLASNKIFQLVDLQNRKPSWCSSHHAFSIE
jgi:hypothetical protein